MIHAPGRGRGFDLAAVCLTLMCFGAFWGCSSEGDPFGRTVRPVIAISGVTPADGSINVPVETLITIAFPLDLDPRTVSASTVHLLDYSQADQLPSMEKDRKPEVFPARVSYDAGSRLVTMVPERPLESSARYQVVLQDVRSTHDVFFNTLVTTFHTGAASQAPYVVSIWPVPKHATVPNTAPITITFSNVMNRISLLSAFSVGPGIAGTSTFQDTSRTVLTFRPGNPYPAGAVITVTVRGDAKDIYGVPMIRGFTSNFKVEPPPWVIGELCYPFDGAANVPRNSAITVVFSTTMTTSTIPPAFSLRFGSTIWGPSNGTFTFQDQGTQAGTVATYTSADPLPASTSVQLRVDNRARSRRGVPLDPIFIADFSTAAQ